MVVSNYEEILLELGYESFAWGFAHETEKLIVDTQEYTAVAGAWRAYYVRKNTLSLRLF